MTLTEPRRRALEVAAARHPLQVIVSNANDLGRGLVYHSTSRWLLEQGYLDPGPDALGAGIYATTLVLTPYGLAMCEAEGIPVGRTPGTPGDALLPADPYARGRKVGQAEMLAALLSTGAGRLIDAIEEAEASFPHLFPK